MLLYLFCLGVRKLNNGTNMKKVILFLGILSLVVCINAKTIDVTNAGTLSRLLTKEDKDTVTTLVLKGFLDARDFKTMRDSMALLKEVDLTLTQIVAYFGADGTVNGNREYSVDLLPRTAFSSNSKIRKVVLPNSLKAISSNVVEACTSLGQIIIPASVEVIDNRAFTSCYTNIVVDANNQYYSSLDGVLYNKDKTLLISCPRIKNGVFNVLPVTTSIGERAFEYCDLLTEVNIPASVEKMHPIPVFRFSNAMITVDESNAYFSSLDGVLYDKDKTVLLYCPNSKTGDFIIPSGVKIIGYSALFACNKLTSLVIPNSVDSIGRYALCNCHGLKSIYVNWQKPINLSRNEISGTYVTGTCTLFVPKGSKTLFSQTSAWNFFPIREYVSTTVGSTSIRDLKLYPNPFVNGFTVNADALESQLAILDLSGRIVHMQQVSGKSYVDMQKLSRGIYLVVVNGESIKLVKR